MGYLKKMIIVVFILLACEFSFSQSAACREAILNAFGFNEEYHEDGQQGFVYVLADGTVSFQRVAGPSPETNQFPGLTPEAIWYTENLAIIRATDGNHYYIDAGFTSSALLSLPAGITTLVDIAADDSETLALSSDGRLLTGDIFTTPLSIVSDADNFGFERIWGNGVAFNSSGIFYAQRADGSVYTLRPGTTNLTLQPGLANLDRLGQDPFGAAGLEAGVFQDGTGGQWNISSGTITVNPIAPPAGELFIDVKVTSEFEYEFLTDAGNVIQYPGGTTILTGIDAISAAFAVNVAVDYDTNTAFYRSGTISGISSPVAGQTYQSVNIPAGYTILAAKAFQTTSAWVLESPSGVIEIWEGYSGGGLPNLSFVDNAPLNLTLRENPSDPVITVNPCACNVSAIVSNNISSCNDNGTLTDGSDDFFTADITVTFGNVPSSGTLDLTGDATSSVAVGSLDSTTSHTFTGVSMSADGTAIAITATFSDDMSCTFSESDTGTAPVSCNVSCDSGADGPRFLSLTARSWAIIGGISVLGIAVFLKREQLF